jgi:hypothetical protein
MSLDEPASAAPHCSIDVRRVLEGEAMQLLNPRLGLVMLGTTALLDSISCDQDEIDDVPPLPGEDPVCAAAETPRPSAAESR